MQGTSLLTASPITRLLGISRNNPLASIIDIAFAVAIIAFFVLLGLVLFGPETNTRYNAGIVLIGFSGLAPLPLALLVTYSRRFHLIEQIVAGDYLVHWRYQSTGLPHQQGDEVYISHQGIYWPARRLRLIDFKSGLLDVEATSDELILHYLERRPRRNYTLNITHEVRVPIPADREEEAAALAGQLRQRLNTRSQALNESWVIASIMGGFIIVLMILSVLLVMPLNFTRMQEQSAARMTLVASTREAQDAALRAALEPISRVIEPQMAALREAGTRTYTPEELGFRSSDNVRQIMTGFCRSSEAFYVMVWEETATIDGYLGSRGVFHYVDGEWLTTCMPEEWEPNGLKVVNSDWNYIYLLANRTRIATLAAETLNRLQTPTPEG
jgi:hypothetical protein